MTEVAQPDRSLWRRATVAGIFLALLLALLVALGIQSSRERRRAADWQMHTYTVLLDAERLAARISELQRGQRGYLLTGKTLYLEPYRQQRATLPGTLDTLGRLSADSPAQQARIAKLRREITTLQSELDMTIAMVSRGDRVGAQALVGTNRGEAVMNDARATLAAFTAFETNLLAQRQARWFAAINRSNTYGIIIGILAISVSIGAVFLLRAAAAAAAAARSAQVRSEALALSREKLQVAIEERTGELATANAGLRAQIDRAREAEAQVRQLQKLEAVGQLTGGIAHDFNNMLAIVLGSLELAQRRLGDSIDEKAARMIANAIDGAKRAAALTARLLAFSRQQPLSPEPVDANALVSSMSDMLRRTIGENIAIETVLAGGLWQAYADAPQLENAIVNLAVNARDAMPGGGKLTIETNNTHLDDLYATQHAEVNAGQYVVICVSDTGSGMPADVIERAFDPFFTTKGVGKGTGLGLSQVFGFVKQSGGHIKIYSELDHGTTVKIYLPRWYGAAAAQRPAIAAWPIPSGTASELILVVEDEEQVREMSSEALRGLGYAVHHAGSGEAALTLIEDGLRPQLLFTDIVMSGINGRVLADRAVLLQPGLKVLYTTGYTRNAVVHNGMLDADVAFLSKPFTIQQLAAKVRQVLDGGGVNRTA